MDLDFVDPPLEPGMVPYELGVAPEHAAERLSAVADELRQGDRLSSEGARQAAEGLEDPSAARVYAENAAFIARFMTIELDTEHDIGKGIARVHPKEPPPRFGDKFRKPLRKAELREAVLPLIDRYLFYGFATGAAGNGLRREPPLAVDVGEPIEERWARFMRHVPITYAAFTKDPSPENPAAAIRNMVCAPVDEAFDGVISMFARPGRRTRAMTYSWYFPAVGWSAYYASIPDSI